MKSNNNVIKVCNIFLIITSYKMKNNFLKERLLLFKAKNKDPEAFAKVYDLYLDRIYRFVFFKISNIEEAQDITSEVFLKTWQYIIDGNNEVKNLNAFFYKIARNLVIDHYRKSSKKNVSLEDIKMLEQEKAGIEDLPKKVQVILEIEKVQARLNDLKDEYREAIILRYIEGLSISEIAEIVEKKKGAVRVILYRALNTLREMLNTDQTKK